MKMHLLAVVGGLLIGGVVVATMEMIGHMVYPPPPEILNLPPGEPITWELSEKIPTGSKAFVLLAWALGAFAGGGLAAWISRESPMPCALIVGLLFLAAGILNLMTIPSPGWFWAIALVEFVPAAYLGGLLGAWRHRRRGAVKAADGGDDSEDDGS